jgi:hypothetical protein
MLRRPLLVLLPLAAALALPGASAHAVAPRAIALGSGHANGSVVVGAAGRSVRGRRHAPPRVAITAGPAPGASVRSASVRFGYAVKGAWRVRCSIDAHPAVACPPSPASYTLAPGRHLFRVDATGRYGRAAAARAFIVAIAPPVRFVSGPADSSTIAVDHTAYGFTAPGATRVRCRLDGRSVACRAGRPVALRGLGGGAHAFSAAASDRFGTTTASRHLTVIAPPRIADIRVDGRKPALGQHGLTIAVASGTAAVTWTAAGSPASATCTVADLTGRCRSGIVLELGRPGAYGFTLVPRNAAGSASRRIAIRVD